MTAIDSTHDLHLSSWVESANAASTDFPIQNLPFGVFNTAQAATPRIGIAIGDQVLDLAACVNAALLNGLDAATRDACCASTLNPLFAIGRAALHDVRAAVSILLRADTPEGRTAQAARTHVMHAMGSCAMRLPAEIGDYTDFYASVHHATNVGSMFRPDNPLLPNYKWIPIGYHGRASSIVASGEEIRRPHGQTRPDANAPPVFGPARSLDYELEIGVFIARGNALGESIRIDDAEQHMAGLCLLNDWSARDIQSWEYQPLGPFLAKNFATTISPWVVTLDALAPYRAAAPVRSADDPSPMPYLDGAMNRVAGAFDIALEVHLSTQGMRAAHMRPVRISQTQFRDMYWTMAQMVTHHASNGCNLRSGDVLGSGTVSGTGRDARGCMLELTWRGQEPLELPNGETRKFLEDGDEVVFRGSCEKEGFRHIGFGECRGIVAPAARNI